MGQIWTVLFVQPITNLLLLLYLGLSYLHIPGPLGWSIIGLTVLIRMFLYPLTVRQLESAKRVSELAPKLKALKEKYGSDAKRHQEEQLRLYREHGVNPAAGCLPALLQIPFVIALYGVFNEIFIARPDQVIAQLNAISYPFLPHIGSLDTMFFNVSLGLKPSDWRSFGVWLFIIPIVTGLLQLILSKMMAPTQQKVLPQKKEGQKESTEETLAAIQGQMLLVFPIMIGYFAYQFPLGLSLYWNALTVFGIIQQYFVSGWGGLSEWKKYVNERTGLRTS